MRALIDGDIIVYRCAFAAQHNIWSAYLSDPSGHGGEHQVKVLPNKHDLNAWMKGKDEEFRIEKEVLYDTEEDCLLAVDSLITNIIRDTGATEYSLYLTGSGNFREVLYPEYKANRKDMEKPRYYALIREHLLEEWGAVLVDGMEADDALSIEQTKDMNRFEPMLRIPDKAGTIICTIDKDLLQVPGKHYNFVSGVAQWVEEIDGLRSFYKQMITGDATDNIPGLSEKKPLKRTYSTTPLDAMVEEKDMIEYVMGGYVEKYGVGCKTMFDLNKELLWMRRE